MTLACPVKGCTGRRRASSMLMCPECWAQVPRMVREGVWRAYGAWQRKPSVESVAALRDAQAVAVAAVENGRPVVGLQEVC